MDFAAVMLGGLVLLCGWAFRILTSRRRPNLPPGPYPFPVIGNILQLGKNPHQSLANLSKTYGPLMSLNLGAKFTVVASSPEIAREILQTSDHVLSSRPIPAAIEAHDHDKLSMGYLPVGNRWRKLRKISREHMFCSFQLDASHGLRQEKLQKLHDYVGQCSRRGRAVNIAEAAFVTSLNLLTASIFSVDFTDFDSDSNHELNECLDTIAKIAAAPNPADFFPVLKAMDPIGVQKEGEVAMGKILAIIRDITDQRLESRKASMGKKSDMLEAILDLREKSEDELSLEEIHHLLMDLLFAGTETSSITVEWAMTELLLNPEIMARAKKEVRSVIGENKQVEESDKSKLPYLQALIKETFRCHPPVPLLVPHKAEEEVQIKGYTIPKNTEILVNIWAMGRDPSIWSKPEVFEPERFLNSKVDFKGQDLTLLPFGSGRRICPGLPLADRMVHLMVGSLIHKFDWKLEEGMVPEKMDLSEKFGLALHKTVPLRAIPMAV